MSVSISKSLLLGAAISVYLVSVGFQSKGSGKTATNPRPHPSAPTFKDVSPIFTANCIGCHGEDRPRAGIDLRDYDSVMRGADFGPIVKKGAPRHSILIQALRGMNGVRHMPPRRDPLPEEKIALIESWIKAGAAK